MSAWNFTEAEKAAALSMPVVSAWVVVPVEPTLDMCSVARTEHGLLLISEARRIYKSAVSARPTGPDVPLLIDASELEMFKQCQRLLYGFMLDTNAIGLTGAAENLARGIKEQVITQEKAK